MRMQYAAWILPTCLFAAPAISDQAAEPDAHRSCPAGRIISFNAPLAAKVVSPACGSSCGTQAFGNNAEGAIVGSYTDENVVPHGFLRTAGGEFISFNAPGAGLGAQLDEGTVAYAINDFGVIVGQFEDSKLMFHGFVRFPGGTYSIIDAPGAGRGAGLGTLAWSINLQGATAGIYFDSNGAEHGFVRSPRGKITTIDPAGSTGTMVCEETCLNADGTITGFFSDATGVFHGFVRDPEGTISGFDPPTSQGTFAASINLFGEITGYFFDAKNEFHGFLRSREGAFTVFDVPGESDAPGQGAAPFSINLFGTAT